MIVYKVYSETTDYYWLEDTEEEARQLVSKLAESGRVYKYIPILI